MLHLNAATETQWWLLLEKSFQEGAVFSTEMVEHGWRDGARNSDICVCVRGGAQIAGATMRNR